jgi:hypothetical protein
VTLLDVLEGAFVAFKDRQRQMQLGTTCECNACRRIPDLTLKLIAHHGSFLRQTVGGHSQVAGPDVILAHRLLKNEFTGSKAYLLVTAPAVARLGIDPAAAGMQAHRETYEHLGEVECFVAALEPVWQRALEARVVRVAPAEADLRLDCVLPVAPPVAWEWMTSAERRQRYQLKSRSVSEDTGRAGRPGPGMRFHCDHGATKIRETVLDWRPFRYFTLDGTVEPLGVTLRITFDFLPEDAGVRVTLLVALAPGTPWWKRLLMKAVKGRTRRDLAANFANLQRLLRDEPAGLAATALTTTPRRAD